MQYSRGLTIGGREEWFGLALFVIVKEVDACSVQRCLKKGVISVVYLKEFSVVQNLIHLQQAYLSLKSSLRTQYKFLVQSKLREELPAIDNVS